MPNLFIKLFYLSKRKKLYNRHSYSTKYLELHFVRDTGEDWRQNSVTNVTNFTFPIVNFLLISRTNHVVPTLTACTLLKSFHDGDILDRAVVLAQKLLKQDRVTRRLNSTSQKFYCRYHDDDGLYGISVFQMTDIFPVE